MTLNNIQLLATIYSMRTSAQYQKAELLRRRSTDVGGMAKDKTSDGYAAVNYQIQIWDVISAFVLDLDDEDRDDIFKFVPFLYMFTELNDAIEVISCEFPDYAANFRLASKHQLEWLKFKDDRYQTAEKGGMHALFG
jgi:hypothetical protein